MSSFTEAADAIRRIARMTEGFQFAAKALDEIGSLTNTTKEAQEAAVASIKARDAAAAELLQVKNDLAIQKSKAKELADEAAAKVISLLAQAQAQAVSVVEAAAAMANDRVAVIEDNAARIQTQIKADTAKIMAERVEVKEQLADVEAEVEAKRKQLDGLNKSLDALKAKLG